MLGRRVAGQYAGFAAILALSLAAAAGLRVMPDRWVGLLGLVPIAFGVWGLWRLRGGDGSAGPALPGTVTRIGALTFANGADNISVFTPLLRALHTLGALACAGLFLALIGLWCAAGALLGGHAVALATLGRATRWLVPVVFIAVGALILATSGALASLAQAL